MRWRQGGSLQPPLESIVSARLERSSLQFQLECPFAHLVCWFGFVFCLFLFADRSFATFAAAAESVFIKFYNSIKCLLFLLQWLEKLEPVR